MFQLRIYTLRNSGVNRLVALICYPPDADPEHLTQRIMGSAEFAADMTGFDVDDIVDVRTVLLDAASFSPIP